MRQRALVGLIGAAAWTDELEHALGGRHFRAEAVPAFVAMTEALLALLESDALWRAWGGGTGGIVAVTGSGGGLHQDRVSTLLWLLL